MRQAFTAFAVGLLALLTAFVADAQQVKLSDGTYPSTAAYLEGTWKWERQEPRQSMIMRFGRDGSFFFHNFTIDLQHWGTYRATGQKLAITLARSCEDKGKNCETRNPPKDLDYSITPTSANVFMANTERWERMK
ncbi:MAG: hypothetical protein E6G95_03895 [Alphaproteobacteria bacterium]|nr:MAG: hypothetical protein E6G95_03895 [Alphaproteobacteria bacterium]